MRIDGYWRAFDDGPVRPVVPAAVIAPDGRIFDVMLLVDTGADRTVLTAEFVAGNRLTVTPAPIGSTLEVVGGQQAFGTVDLVLAFLATDGNVVQVNGPFSAFTDPTALDLSVLGRDVLSNFDVVVSRRHDEVLILTGPHTYHVRPAP